MEICFLYKKAYSGFVIHEFWNKRKKKKWGQQSDRVKVLLF